MSLTSDLNAIVDKLVYTAVSAPDEPMVRANLQELAAALHGAADSMDRRLIHGSFDIGGRPAPFQAARK